MHVLLTRPEEDSLQMAAQFRSLGIDVTIMPMTTIVYRAMSIHEKPEAFVLTSRHGAHVLETYPHKDVPVYTVGSSTAYTVHNLGFRDVRDGGGNSDDLINRILEDKPASLLYLSGETISRDLITALEPHGITCRRQIVYGTEERSTPVTLGPSITHVLFFSKRSAQIFAHLWKRENNLADHLPTFLCMSPGVKEVFSVLNYPDNHLWVAPRPTRQSMMDYFYDHAQRNAS